MNIRPTLTSTDANAIFEVDGVSETVGALTVNGAAMSAGDIVSVADITAGNFRFTPAANLRTELVA